MDKKTTVRTFRASEDVFQTMKENADKEGVSVGKYIVNSALAPKGKTLTPEEECSLISVLNILKMPREAINDKLIMKYETDVKILCSILK